MNHYPPLIHSLTFDVHIHIPQDDEQMNDTLGRHLDTVAEWMTRHVEEI